jgi:hypothetical protein
MITIFSDFRQFSAEKNTVFLENQCFDPNLAKNSAIFNKKRPCFHQIFGRKYF